MQFLDLPLVLVRDILALFVLSGEIIDVIRARRVNCLFNREVLYYCAKLRLWDLSSKHEFLWYLPEPVKLKLVRDAVGTSYGGYNSKKLAIHAVTDHLETRLSQTDARIDREAILLSVCKAAWFQYGSFTELSEESKFRVSRQGASTEDVSAASFIVALVAPYPGLRDEMISKGSRPCAQTEHFGNALEIAAQLGNLELVEMLLEIGPCREHRKEWRICVQKALDGAAKAGDGRMINLLMDPKRRCKTHGRTYDAIIGRVAYRGQFQIARRLLDAHTEITPSLRIMMYFNAIRHGNIELITEMLDSGVDINAYWQRSGPLRVAAEANHAHVLRFLLERGANQPYCQWAQEAKSVEVLDILLEHGLDLQTEGFRVLHGQVYADNVEMAQALYDRGYRLSSDKNQQSTARYALNRAAQHGKLGMIRWLILVLGVRPDYARNPDCVDQSPVAWAMECAQPTSLQLLFELGAPPLPDIESYRSNIGRKGTSHYASERRKREVVRIHDEWRAKVDNIKLDLS